MAKSRRLSVVGTSAAKIPEKDIRNALIEQTLQETLGLSVPKYVSIMIGCSQKTAQIAYNQPEKRSEKDREKDDALFNQIYQRCLEPRELEAHFIDHLSNYMGLKGLKATVLQNIRSTIDSVFQNREAYNTITEISRPAPEDSPEMVQLNVINWKYFTRALDMQTRRADARLAQDEAREHGKKSSVRIPYTMEQIKEAFQVPMDMCDMLISIKSAEGPMDRQAKHVIARAYITHSASALQLGRYDIVEADMSRWKDLELHQDQDVPLRIRNILIEKELFVLDRKREIEKGLQIAEEAWAASGEGARWMDLDPLATSGLELAASYYEEYADENEQEAVDIVHKWLDRLAKAPDQSAELGRYLKLDQALAAIRESGSPFVGKIDHLLSRFGV